MMVQKHNLERGAAESQRNVTDTKSLRLCDSAPGMFLYIETTALISTFKLASFITST